MKKTIIGIAVLSVILFTGCSDDSKKKTKLTIAK